jgi:hypothetical protein
MPSFDLLIQSKQVSSVLKTQESKQQMQRFAGSNLRHWSLHYHQTHPSTRRPSRTTISLPLSSSRSSRRNGHCCRNCNPMKGMRITSKNCGLDMKNQGGGCHGGAPEAWTPVLPRAPAGSRQQRACRGYGGPIQRGGGGGVRTSVRFKTVPCGRTQPRIVYKTYGLCPGAALSRSEAQLGLFAAAGTAAEALHGNFFLATLSRSAGQLGLFSAGGRQLNTTGIGNTTGTIRRA